MSNITRLGPNSFELTHEGTVHALTVTNSAYARHAGERGIILVGNVANGGDKCTQLVLSETVTLDALRANIDELCEAFSGVRIENIELMLGTVTTDGRGLFGEDGNEYMVASADLVQVWANSNEDNEVTGVNILPLGCEEPIVLAAQDPAALARIKNAAVILVSDADGACPHTVFDIGDDMSLEHDFFTLYDQAFNHFVTMISAASEDVQWFYSMVRVDTVEDKGGLYELTLNDYHHDTKIKFAVPKPN